MEQAPAARAALAALGLTAVAAAQAQAPYLPGRISRVAANYTAIEAAGRCQTGNLTPDLRVDALVQFGSAFHCVSAVDTLGQVIELDPFGDGAPVLDAVVAPASGRDTAMCLVQTSSGVDLVEARFEYLEESSAGVDRFVPIASATRSELQAAEKLAVGNYDGDTQLDIFVLCGTQALWFERSSAGGLVYVASESFASGLSELELAPFGAAEREDLIAWGAGGVFVRSSAPNGGLAITDVSDIRCVAPWHCSSAGAGRLAIITRQLDATAPGVFQDTTRLHVRGVGYAEPVLSLGGLMTSDAIAADLLGIGTGSLFLLNQFGPVLVSLFDFGGPLAGAQNTFNIADPWYSAAEVFEIDAGATMTEQSGRSAAVDVDDDGDLDVLFVCDATDDLHVKHNPLVDEISKAPWISKVESLYDSFPAAPNGWGQNFRFELLASSIVAGATHLQISLYQVLNDNYVPSEVGDTLRFVGGGLWPVSALETTSATDVMTPAAQPLAAAAEYADDYRSHASSYGQTARYLVLVRALEQTGGAFKTTGPELVYRFAHSRLSNDTDPEPDIGTPDPIEPEPLPPPPPRRVPPGP